MSHARYEPIKPIEPDFRPESDDFDTCEDRSKPAGDGIIPYTMKTGIIFPRSLFDETCADAQQQARRTGKTQYVRGMNWDGLYGSLGFTNDPEMEIGRLHAIVTADKIMLLDSNVQILVERDLAVTPKLANLIAKDSELGGA